jgi:mono/diheme cytochrome c family protein
MHSAIRLEVDRRFRPVLCLATLFWASGCSSEISATGRPQAGFTERTSSSDAAKPGAGWKPALGNIGGALSGSSGPQVPAAAMASTCEELANAAEAMLKRYCVGCHGDGNAQGGFGDVLDVPAMIARSLLVPGDPSNSRVFELVDSGVMPKSVTKPAKNEIETLGAWVECGAADWADSAADDHPAFMSIEERLSTIREDLEAGGLPPRDSRFIDLSQLSNAGMGASEIGTYRAAISLLLNSLSYADQIATPEPIGRDGLLLRVDLRSYGWDASTWELITAAYPYAVRYYDSGLAGQAYEIQAQIGAEIAYVQADWLLAHASRPPLYYDLLGVPEAVDQFIDFFGIDVRYDFNRSDAVRAGFNGSGVSVSNRVIERHEMPKTGGALWLSYDFSNSLDYRNVFAHPLDFQQDGGEGILSLPNGLQAYFLVDTNFTRLAKAPTEIVTDPNTKDGAVEAGLSCVGGCHLTRGIIHKTDQVRDYVENSPAPGYVIDRTRELYPEAAEMQDRMDGDIERYRNALAQTGFPTGDQTALIRRVRTHDDLLDINAVAGVLGLPADELQKALESSPQAFPPEIATLQRPSATIYRNVLDQAFPALVFGLRLGQVSRFAEPVEQPDPEPQPEPEAAPQPEPDPAPQPEPDPEPQPEPDPEPQPEPDPAPQPEPDPEPDPAPPPDAGADDTQNDDAEGESGRSRRRRGS